MGNDTYAGKFYPNASNPKDAKTVKVIPSQETKNINFQLSRGFTISGTVKDILGNPIAGVGIAAFYQGEAPPLGSAVTDGGGHYTTNALSSANYYIHAGDKEGYLGVFYPDASYVYGRSIPPQGAIAIRIATQNLSDYNFVLQEIDKPIIGNMILSLQSLVTIEPNGKRLSRSINAIVKDLQDLEDATGIRYFNLEQKVVTELMNLRRADITETSKILIDGMIKQLVNLAKIKAQAAVLEAKSIPVRKPVYARMVEQLIRQADDKMTQANSLSLNRSDQAINYFGQAWKLAQDAMIRANQN